MIHVCKVWLMLLMVVTQQYCVVSKRHNYVITENVKFSANTLYYIICAYLL